MNGLLNLDFLYKEIVMLLDWSLSFLVIALIAAIFGFSGIAQESANIAKILFVVFLILYVAMVVKNQLLR